MAAMDFEAVCPVPAPPATRTIPRNISGAAGDPAWVVTPAQPPNRSKSNRQEIRRVGTMIPPPWRSFLHAQKMGSQLPLHRTHLVRPGAGQSGQGPANGWPHPDLAGITATVFADS